MGEKLMIGLIGLIIIMVCTIFLSPLIFLAQRNVYHEYSGEVIATEKSAWIFKTTTITMKTYAESSVTFTVNGYHDFKIGQAYKIATQGGWFWHAPNLISVEEL